MTGADEMATIEPSLRAAVVGAGPSGVYATDQLLKADIAVDPQPPASI